MNFTPLLFMKPLTKTDFILYRECPNNVWVKLHKPEEYAKFEVSDFEKSLAVMGNEVEELARGMFPSGILVGGRGEEAQKFTKKLLAERTPVIFQAVFTTDKYLAATDVLKWNEEANAYDLYEIKMSSTFDDEEDEDEEGKPKKVKKGEEPSKPRKLNQVRVHKSQEPIVDFGAIKAELNSLTFPLYFLDYETCPTAIPLFDGYHPYQHIVFQYSLHVLKDKDAELEHFEFLSLEGDPAERIVESLRSRIGDTGSVISWYKKFEISRNRELANLVPLQFSFLHGVIDRTYDLMDIVDNQYYVHQGFKGSASIKKVLPAIKEVLKLPTDTLSYENLAVRNGTDAIEAYKQITTVEMSEQAIEEKKKQMLEYCKLDTEAMYVLWRFFYGLVH